MFTGIIEAQGTVMACDLNQEGGRLVLSTSWDALSIGESIAVNGVCLTLLESAPGTLCFDVSSETLRVTQLGQLQTGDVVHLERALQLSARLGGHYVTGHVDTTAIIEQIEPQADCQAWIVGGFSPEMQAYVLPKGSITLNGVSLTINAVHATAISVMLIPHTLAHTTFHQAKVGDRLNVEFDYLTRIIAHQLRVRDESFNTH